MNLHYFKKCWRLSIQIEIVCIFKSATLFSPLDSGVKLWGPILRWRLCDEQVAMGQRMRVSEAGTCLLSLPLTTTQELSGLLSNRMLTGTKRQPRLHAMRTFVTFPFLFSPPQGGNVKWHSETAGPLCAWRCWLLFYHLYLSHFPLLGLEVFYLHENRKARRWQQSGGGSWW